MLRFEADKGLLWDPGAVSLLTNQDLAGEVRERGYLRNRSRARIAGPLLQLDPATRLKKQSILVWLMFLTFVRNISHIQPINNQDFHN